MCDLNHIGNEDLVVSDNVQTCAPWGKGGRVTTRDRRSVLCIGDDPVNLNLRCALLKNKGWRVTGSGSGHDGVLRFQQEPVALVIIDLDRDGSEAALIISELKRLRPNVRVLMLVTDRGTLATGATKQADAVLAKAEESEHLVGALKKLERKG